MTHSPFPTGDHSSLLSLLLFLPLPRCFFPAMTSLANTAATEVMQK